MEPSRVISTDSRKRRQGEAHATLRARPRQPTTPAFFDVQQTTFSHDILGRYTCNTWSEIDQQRLSGGYPFDAVVVGAGMFGGYCAEKLYRHGARQDMRVLLIDAGRSCCRRTSRICRSDWAAQSAVQMSRPPGTTASGTSSGACRGSATKCSPGWRIASAGARCSGVDGRPDSP